MKELRADYKNERADKSASPTRSEDVPPTCDLLASVLSSDRAS